MRHMILILCVLALAACTTTTTTYPDGRVVKVRAIATDAIVEIAPVIVEGASTIADLVRQIREAEAARDAAQSAEERAEWQAKADALRAFLETLRAPANINTGEKIIMPDYTAGFNG